MQIDIEGVGSYDIEPGTLPDLFHGSPLRLYGRYRDSGRAQVRLRALSAAEARAGLERHPAVLFVESVPHEWLLRRVVAAVHHGGVGTTAAALRAGLPTIVFPTWGDQTLWAQRVHALGVGPRPIHIRWIEPIGLERALRALLDGAPYRERARSLAEVLRAAPGAEAVVPVLEELHESRVASAPVDDRAVVE